jgi:hypothetical protein
MHNEDELAGSVLMWGAQAGRGGGDRMQQGMSTRTYGGVYNT